VHLIDRAGSRFGRLSVVERGPNQTVRGKSRVMWLCLCDCGATVAVEAYSLTSGNKWSCGCLALEGPLAQREYARQPSVSSKTCAHCKEHKTAALFNKDRSSKDGLDHRCKACSAAYHTKMKLKWRRTPKGQAAYRRKWLKTYGLDEAEYARILLAQASKCAACGTLLETSKDAHVDHCHTTGRVRGILCKCCNVALGFARDNPATLRRLAEYLEASKETRCG
jgi:hypothetical protein